VFCDRVCRTNEVSSVVADNFDAALSITNHLYQSGAKKIAHIAGPKHLNISKERVAGYLAGLRECRLSFNEDFLIETKLTYEDAVQATLKLLSLKTIPDAIFAVNSTVAFAAMKTIKNAGLKIPEDIALIAFTDEFHATIVEPELTSVIHPTFEIGQEAARLLINQVESTTALAPRQIIMKTQLAIRNSTTKISAINQF
jgi:LacI family transcriptional regulator